MSAADLPYGFPQGMPPTEAASGDEASVPWPPDSTAFDISPFGPLARVIRGSAK